jgi:hypothetical protein
MVKRSCLASTLTLVWMLFSGGADAAEGDDAQAFGPGEQCTYAVKYLGIVAGTAQITVGSELQLWGRSVWPIVTVARTDSKLAVYPVKDRFVTYWDMLERRSIGSDLYADENNKRRRQKIRLDHDARAATVTKQKEGEPAHESELEIEPGTGDIAAAVFALRNMPLAVGKEFSLPVVTGSRTFNLKAKVEGRQPLTTPLGEREVFKVRVQTEFAGKFESKRDIFAYITADEAHVPVRMEAEFVLGALIADLTAYQPGNILAVNFPRTP